MYPPSSWLISVIIQSILVFVTLALPLLLYILPDASRKRNLALITLILLAGYHTVLDLTVDQPLFGSFKIHLAGGALILLYGPLVYGYARRLLGRSVANWPWHCLPASLGFVYVLLFGFSHGLFFSVMLIQYGVYACLIYRETGQSSSTHGAIIRWVRFVTCGFGSIWLAAILVNALNALGFAGLSTYFEQAMFVFCVGYFTSLVYVVLVRPELFRRARIQPRSSGRRSVILDRSATTRMTELRRLFEDERIYLDADLHRDALANRFGISAQQFSTEVNEFFALSLPDLINGYRIEAAKNRLLMTGCTIKEVYYAVGFNSRSAFNANFRKRTGVTPSEYRSLQPKVT